MWWIATQPYPEAHFATFPRALVVPCIKAGTSEKGACRFCGAPWERVTRTVTENRSGAGRAGTVIEGKGHPSSQVRHGHDVRNGPTTVESTTIGWRPTCRCPGQRGLTVPCTVLDCFSGAGTTALVARDLGRASIGIDVNSAYTRLAEQRTAQGGLPLAP